MTGQAIPHTEYSQHLQRCLSSRFCHASGLTLEQGQQPDLLQQGIALLVSALESGPKSRCHCSAEEEDSRSRDPKLGSPRPAALLQVDEGMCMVQTQVASVPAQQAVHTRIDAVCERSKSFPASA